MKKRLATKKAVSRKAFHRKANSKKEGRQIAKKSVKIKTLRKQ